MRADMIPKQKKSQIQKASKEGRQRNVNQSSGGAVRTLATKQKPTQEQKQVDTGRTADCTGLNTD